MDRVLRDSRSVARGRFAITLLVAMSWAFASAQAAQGQTAQPTLTGEALAGFSFVDTNAQCHADGSTITFNTAGAAGGELPFDDIDPAGGPYPGTFDASGTVKSGPSAFTGDQFGGVLTVGTAVTLTETFRIESGDTVITGTKTLDGVAPEGFVVCGEFTRDGVANQVREIEITNARYEATISTPDGTYKDHGSSQIQVNHSAVEPFPIPGVPIRSSNSERFREFFVSDFVVAEPALPTGSEQCVIGDFEAFGVFKNQGDCVAFVKTEGKNEPGQNIPNPQR